MSGFRLASLLRLRTLAEDRAASALAQTRREERAAAQRRHDTEVMLAGQDLFSIDDDPRVWQAVIAARASLGSLVLDRRIDENRAGLLVASAEQEWSAARARTKALEKLAERHEQTEQAEDLRAEQIVLDEIAGRVPPSKKEEKP